MGKFILFNLLAASLYVAPVLLSKKLCHQCSAKSIGTAETLWMSVEDDKEDAVNNALKMCTLHSQKPKQCEIIDCIKQESGC
jgi:glycine/serine hydroxymethyltransferase